MRIRRADFADLPALLSAVERMVSESTFAKTQKFNRSQSEETLWFLIQNERAVCLILEDGKTFAGAYIGKAAENAVSGDRWLGEIFLWTEPKYRGHGGKLKAAAEAAAKELGCTSAVLSHPASAPRVGKLYQRWGYELTELVYRKAI